MEEKIIELLKTENRGFDITEIEDYLGIKDALGLAEVLKCLHSLEEAATVYQSKSKKYMLLVNSHLKTGRFIGNRKGFGFVVIQGEEDIFVAKNNVNGAIDGDTVILEIFKKGMKPEGRILSIVNRANKLFVGEYYYKDKKGHIIFDDNKISIDVIIEPSKSMNAMDGHKVLIKLGKKLKANTYEGEVVKIIGHKNDPGVDILSIIAKYDFSDQFPEEVMKELDNIPNEIDEKDIKNRTDLRDVELFTIDGDDAKDLDDAVSLKMLENGNYELGVHIADVSFYVKENTEIDKEAYNRGTSVYLVDRVLPMLPHKLSNGICSLNGGVDRFAISCIMEINDKGNVVNYNVFPSVIRSKLRMTYKKVNDILDKNIVDELYKPFEKTLRNMKKLSDILRENKRRRGYIDFEIPEVKILVDEKGKPIELAKREQGTGEKLIEDFMIAANETVATYINNMELPFIYRVHGEPSEEKISSFLNFVQTLGYKPVGKVKKSSPQSVQNLLNQLKNAPEYPIFSELLLRSMQKAVYSENNIGHFGLGSTCYTHFTSPIRRYPDLFIHRIISKYIDNSYILNEKNLEKYKEQATKYSQTSSEREKIAQKVEREAIAIKKAEYMQNKIGKEYEGIVSGITAFGMFVELENTVEGLIKFEDLGNEYFIYNDENKTLIGENSKKIYKIGDKIKIKVIYANKQLRRINFKAI